MPRHESRELPRSQQLHRRWPRKTLAPLCTTAIAIALIPTVFQPVESALLNWSEMSLGFQQLFGLLALPFVLLSAGLLASLCALQLLAPTRAMAMSTALLLCLWLQGSAFVWDYGVFDGSPIDWGLHAGKGALELGGWIAIFALAVARPEWLRRRATAIAGIASLVQALGLIGTYVSHAPYEEHLAAAADRESETALAEAQQRAVALFSPERNVIVLVLDTLQSDFFAELLRDPAFARRVPAGFRYYRNAVAPYPHTQHSLPAMLTSLTPGQQPKPRWTVEQMKKSVPAKLAELGWSSSVVTTTPPYLACNQLRFAFGCESQRSYIAGPYGSQELEAADDARSLLRIAAFRVVPHYAKAWVHDEGRWRVPDPFPVAEADEVQDERIWYESQRDLRTWNKLIQGASADSSAPTFKLLHFFAAHHPSSIGDDCEWNGHANPERSNRNAAATRDRQVALGASRCAFSRTFDFLERLDELRVYDASLIFIVGDHGRQHSPVDLALADPPLPQAREARGSASSLTHASKGVPLMLVKRAGSRSALEISDASVSLCDLPSSIFSELGYDHTFGCESIFAIHDARQTPRLHFRGMDDYENRFSVYRVDDHSWRAKSWQPMPSSKH